MDVNTLPPGHHIIDEATTPIPKSVDSDYWLVWARDEAVRERIRKAFTAVETIPGESFYSPKG